MTQSCKLITPSFNAVEFIFLSTLIADSIICVQLTCFNIFIIINFNEIIKLNYYITKILI